MKQPTKYEINNIDIKKLDKKYHKWFVYRKGYYDIQFFIRYHLSHYLVDDKGNRIKPGPFHLDFLNNMQSRENVVIRFPRNHGKTTNIIFTTIHDICYEKEKGILFIMQKGLGEKTLNKIRVEFENNKRILSIFGTLVPTRKKEEQNKTWRQNYLMFMNGIDLQAISKGQAIRGARKTKGYMDDPEEDKETKNERIMLELRDRIAGTIMPIFSKGNLKVTGTVIHNNCFVNFLYNNENTFKKLSMDAVTDPKFFKVGEKRHLVGGKAIRTERMGIKVLNNLLQDMQSVSGNGFDIRKREFLHKPFNDRGERIRKSHHLDKLVTPEYTKDSSFDSLRIYGEPQSCIIGVDTAGGRLTGDYSAISVRSEGGELLAFWYDRGGPEVIVSVLDRLYDLGYDGIIAIEVNNETGGSTVTLAEYRKCAYNLYRRGDIESISGKKQYKYGRQTNIKTRRTALGEYDIAIRGGDEDSNIPPIIEVDQRLYNELETFIRNPDNGKREAGVGEHDDAIMCDAICRQMRNEHKTERV